MENKPWVFISAPYTNPYPIYNTRKAMEWWNKLYDTKLIIPIVPHWTMFQDLIFPRPYEDWLEYDLTILERCDSLFRLKGDSNGADREVKQAELLNKRIFFEEQYSELIEWAKEWNKKI